MIQNSINIVAATKAVQDLMVERARQVNEEGWTIAHDDRYTKGEMASAATAYALNAADQLNPNIQGDADTQPYMWPWPAHWWKPTSVRRDLVKAGALILAQIEQLDRQVDLGANPDSVKPAVDQQPSPNKSTTIADAWKVIDELSDDPKLMDMPLPEAIRALMASAKPAPETEIESSCDTERWEIGLRNIVTVLGGARKPFEIKEVVETIRQIVHGHAEGPTLAWYNGVSATNGNAKARYEKSMEGSVELDPIERLRFYCSCAMRGQDWLDAEPLFDDVLAERTRHKRALERLASHGDGLTQNDMLARNRKSVAAEALYGSYDAAMQAAKDTESKDL